MRVTLARPFDGHPARATVDLPTGTARQLVRDGHARLAPPEPAPAVPRATPSPRREPDPTPPTAESTEEQQ